MGLSLDAAVLLYCSLLSALFLLPFSPFRHDYNLNLTILKNFYLKFAINVYFCLWLGICLEIVIFGILTFFFNRF